MSITGDAARPAGRAGADQRPRDRRRARPQPHVHADVHAPRDRHAPASRTRSTSPSRTPRRRRPTSSASTCTRANVSGATVVGEPTREIESIAPGDSATVSFDLVSRLSGKVTAATLDSDENVAGRFQLKTAVGELGIPLSPDSLVLPKEAALAAAGPARRRARPARQGVGGGHRAAGARCPKDVTAVLEARSSSTAPSRWPRPASASSLHEPLTDSAAQLLMDFAGSNYARGSPTPRDPETWRSRETTSTGFDVLRRSSVRGDVFAAAVAALLGAEPRPPGPAAVPPVARGETGTTGPASCPCCWRRDGARPVRLAIVDGTGAAWPTRRAPASSSRRSRSATCCRSPTATGCDVASWPSSRAPKPARTRSGSIACPACPTRPRSRSASSRPTPPATCGSASSPSVTVANQPDALGAATIRSGSPSRCWRTNDCPGPAGRRAVACADPRRAALGHRRRAAGRRGPPGVRPARTSVTRGASSRCSSARK